MADAGGAWIGAVSKVREALGDRPGAARAAADAGHWCSPRISSTIARYQWLPDDRRRGAVRESLPFTRGGAELPLPPAERGRFYRSVLGWVWLHKIRVYILCNNSRSPEGNVEEGRCVRRKMQRLCSWSNAAWVAAGRSQRMRGAWAGAV